MTEPTTDAGRAMHDWLGWHPIDGRDEYIAAIEAEAAAAERARILAALPEALHLQFDWLLCLDPDGVHDMTDDWWKQQARDVFAAAIAAELPE